MASVKLVNQPQNGAQVTLANQTSFEMTLQRSHNWSGSPASPGLPPNIMPDRPAIFSHLSDGDFGSSGTVIYTGRNLSGLPCAWVLAWSAPSESSLTPNQVYVACGSKFEIDEMSFDQIREWLKESTGDSSAFNNPTKTRAHADIHDIIPNRATVTSTFTLDR